MGHPVERGTPAGGDNAPLPGATHHVPRAPLGRGRRHHAATAGPLADHRDRRRRRGRDHQAPHRGLQGVARRPTRPEQQAAAKNTQRHRLRMIRIFLERLIAWDWPDAPARNPILHGDIPPRTEPIPRFLTDQQAAAFMAAARTHPLPRDRLVAQVLARTGLRANELCELAADSVTRIGTDGYWLRVPIGKLRNHRIIARIGAIAGIDDMHPHRLRHTLATYANNRGMRLEAIAALLGHRSLEMTLVYAKITDRVVADEYASVCEQIDALYNTANTPGALPAEIDTAAMTRLRQESHARMLGNGMCTRPLELDCRMATICETCAYFATGPQFVPVLLRQRDHARTHHQTDRAQLYDTLITTADANSPWASP